MARILFYIPLPPPDLKHYVPFHRGAAVIVSVLKSKGHLVRVRMPWRITPEEVARDCREFEADHVFLSLASPQAHMLPEIAKATADLSLPLLVGGSHPTFAPEEVLSVPGVTAVAVGEGEEAAPAFVEGARRVPGLVFPGHALSAGRLARLEELPPPDRRAFFECPDFELERKIVGHEFATGRGCPFRCLYCANGGYKKLYGPAHHRRVPVEAAIREITETLRLDPRVDVIGFHDDIFTADPGYLAEFADRYRRTMRIPFWANAHPNLLSQETVRLLARAGCRRIHLGVETGNEELRARVLGRHIPDSVIVEAAVRLKKAGIRLVTFVMLGIPGENEKSYGDTVRLLRRIKPSWIIQSYFTPLPGTVLGEGIRKRLPIRRWSEILEGSFYLEPRRSWSEELDVERLKEMGRNLLREVYG